MTAPHAHPRIKEVLFLDKLECSQFKQMVSLSNSIPEI